MQTNFLSINPRPVSAFSNLDNSSSKQTEISCVIQKSLEHLIKKERFLKNSNTSKTFISDKKTEKRSIPRLRSSLIKISNKSAEYENVLPVAQPMDGEYHKFKQDFAGSVLSRNGFFLYSEKNRKEHKNIFNKVHENISSIKSSRTFRRKNVNKDNPSANSGNGKLKIINDIRERSIAFIDEAISKSNFENAIKVAKNQIEVCIQETREISEKLQFENEVLKSESNKNADAIKELADENLILQQQNQNVLKNQKEMKCKFDNLYNQYNELKKFEPAYNKLKENFQENSVDKLIDKLKYLEEVNMNLVKKQSDFEDLIRILEQNKKKEIEDLQNKLIDFKNLNIKNEKNVESLRLQLQNQNTDFISFDNYKKEYTILFNKLIETFTELTKTNNLFFDPKDNFEPKAYLNDPIEVLDLIQKMGNLSTDKKLHDYVRKIIVHANVLQRKFFPENVNEKFDPDKIYERITQFINQLKGEILKLRTENNNIKIELDNKKREFMIFKSNLKIKPDKTIVN